MRRFAFGVLALVLCACQDSSDRFQDMIAEGQRVREQGEKDRRLIAAAFKLYLQRHAQFEQRYVALSTCGDQAFVTAHAQDAVDVFVGFMMQRVDTALKDREPVRDRSKETPEQREMLDGLAESSILRATAFLDRQAYYADLQQAYREGLFSAYTSLGDGTRAGLCSGVEQYRADVLATIAQYKAKPAQ